MTFSARRPTDHGLEIAAPAAMGPVPRAPRVMLYSHDTYGLGHLRRSRALAQAITAADPTASALIVTGSPVAGRFTFSERVDHIRLPGVTKRRDGNYEVQALGMDIDKSFRLQLAVSNLLDQTTVGDLGYRFADYYDQIGRRYKITATTRF